MTRPARQARETRTHGGKENGMKREEVTLNGKFLPYKKY